MVNKLSAKPAIQRLVTYYQEFHHKCISWYITVTGFFVAGLIAVGNPQGNAQYVWLPVAGVTIAIGITFFLCVFHYSARISYLQRLVESPENEIPENWRSAHKEQGIAVHGYGSFFFLTIILIMQVAVFSLLALRYG